MTTPDTAAVRAWARENGMAVADRGRLPAELRAAYLAAQDGGATGTGSKAGAKSGAKGRTAAGSSASRKASPAPRRAQAPVEAPLDAPAKAAVPDEATTARLAALEEQVAALVARVARLEQPADATPTPKPAAKPSRFRRRA